MKLLQLPTLFRRTILISILPIALGFFIGGLIVFIGLAPLFLGKIGAEYTQGFLSVRQSYSNACVVFAIGMSWCFFCWSIMDTFGWRFTKMLGGCKDCMEKCNIAGQVGFFSVQRFF